MTQSLSPPKTPFMTSEFVETVLAGGCFWGVEELFRKESGVLKTLVGYTGGHTDQPTYERVKTGETGHAEALLIRFDPQKTNYQNIFSFFFSIHEMNHFCFSLRLDCQGAK